eukprot:3137744-Prymnesium_polylepis.2
MRLDHDRAARHRRHGSALEERVSLTVVERHDRVTICHACHGCMHTIIGWRHACGIVFCGNLLILPHTRRMARCPIRIGRHISPGR